MLLGIITMGAKVADCRRREVRNILHGELWGFAQTDEP